MQSRRRVPRPQSSGSGANGIVGVLFFASVAMMIAGSIMVGTHAPSSDVRAKNYDYVIVGGGAAGSVVAERLSRSGRHSVLLVEAGPEIDDDENLTLLGSYTTTLARDFFNSFFWQAAQDNNLDMPKWQYSDGRVLGGHSKVNDAVFVRGTDWMFDEWELATGDPIWAAVNALQAFKELETYESPLFNSARRGASGPLHVWEQMSSDTQEIPTTMSELFVQAVEQMTNLTRLDDYNDMFAASRLGPFLKWQFTAFPNRTRHSADVAILTPAVRARKNLQISKSSTATHVIFSGNKQAKAVRYLHNGKEHVAHAKRRIVLSAGINTPAILQHSGIGDVSTLESAGVPVVVNNSNVGIHLVTHNTIQARFLKNNAHTPSSNLADIYEGGALLPDPRNVPDPVSPRRIQLIAINNQQEMAVRLSDLQPTSTGYTQIIDKDPLRISRSSSDIFDDSGDMDLLVKSVQQYICGLHEEFNGYGHGPFIDDEYRLVDPPLQICNNTDAIHDWVLANLDPFTFQWSSMCKMGTINDGTSVTNSRGSVWGVTGLTIADRCLFPRPHDGDVQAASYLVGMIIAEQIIAENF